MLSKNKIKLIESLNRKKVRDERNLFIAEGSKLVLELAEVFRCSLLMATAEWLSAHSQTKADEIIEVSEKELNGISNQKTPQGVFAVFEKPSYSWDITDIKQRLSLALDDVQDPGNLGTILRVADWFGINDVFCSPCTADAFSPKVVQASMGAVARVRVHTVDLVDFLQNCTQHIPIYGTLMDGNDIYNSELQSKGIIVMGNEGNGISENVRQTVSHKLLIPNFPKGVPTSESLNVSVAAALVCAEFRRRQ